MFFKTEKNKIIKMKSICLCKQNINIWTKVIIIKIYKYKPVAIIPMSIVVLILMPISNLIFQEKTAYAV